MFSSLFSTNTQNLHRVLTQNEKLVRIYKQYEELERIRHEESKQADRNIQKMIDALNGKDSQEGIDNDLGDAIFKELKLGVKEGSVRDKNDKYKQFIFNRIEQLEHFHKMQELYRQLEQKEISKAAMHKFADELIVNIKSAANCLRKLPFTGRPELNDPLAKELFEGLQIIYSNFKTWCEKESIKVSHDNQYELPSSLDELPSYASAPEQEELKVGGEFPKLIVQAGTPLIPSSMDEFNKLNRPGYSRGQKIGGVISGLLTIGGGLVLTYLFPPAGALEITLYLLSGTTITGLGTWLGSKIGDAIANSNCCGSGSNDDEVVVQPALLQAVPQQPGGSLRVVADRGQIPVSGMKHDAKAVRDGQPASPKRLQQGSAPSARPAARPTNSSSGQGRGVLDKAGQNAQLIEQLGDHTAEMVDDAGAFRNMARQAKEKAKDNASWNPFKWR